MKKIYIVLAMLITFIFAGVAASNTVIVKLDNLFDSVLISSVQMKFTTEPGVDLPFLSDDDDVWAEADFTIETNFGDDSAIFRNPIMYENWDAEALEDYDGRISTADGFIAYTIKESTEFALHNGFLAKLSSEDSIFRVDLETIQLYDFVDTLNPITGLIITEQFDGDNQLITISNVPIPTTLFLLGSGLIGLIGLRRKQMNK